MYEYASRDMHVGAQNVERLDKTIGRLVVLENKYLVCVKLKRCMVGLFRGKLAKESC